MLVGMSSALGPLKRFDADSPDPAGEVPELDIVQRIGPTDLLLSKAYLARRPTTNRRDFTLIAATQISDGIRGESLRNADHSLAWWSLSESGITFGDSVTNTFETFPRPCPLVVFACMVCEDAGPAKREVDIAFVKATKHTWSVQRHRVV